MVPCFLAVGLLCFPHTGTSVAVAESLFHYGGRGALGDVTFDFVLATDEIEDPPVYETRRCRAGVCFGYAAVWRVEGDQAAWTVTLGQDGTVLSAQRFTFRASTPEAIRGQLARIQVRSMDGAVTLPLDAFAAED